jgi:AcrR family transcriptional regulator
VTEPPPVDAPTTADATAATETTGERVQRIATELFAERGFDATGVQELSDATGLGRGALYYHINSKGELLQRIAEGLLERAIGDAKAIVARDEPVEARLRALSNHLLVDLATHRDAWVISMRDWEALQGQARDRVRAMRNEYESLWQQLFDEAAGTGVLSPVQPILRRAIIGLYTSSYRWIDSSGPLQPEEISELYVDFILRGLTPPPPIGP